MIHQLRSTRHGIESRSCSACGAGLMAGNVYCIDCGARIASKGLVVPNDEHYVEGVDVNEEDSLNATAPTFSPFASSLPVNPSSLPSEASYYENAQRALVVAKTIGLPLTADSLATTHKLLKLQAMVRANPKAAQLGQLSIQPPLLPRMPTSLSTSSSHHFRKAHISPAALRSRPLNSEASDPFQVHMIGGLLLIKSLSASASLLPSCNVRFNSLSPKSKFPNAIFLNASLSILGATS